MIRGMISIRKFIFKLNGDTLTALVGLITTIVFLVFIRLIRPIDLDMHRDLAGLALFLISALFFLWILIDSSRGHDKARAA
jgi:hypothetical protein